MDNQGAARSLSIVHYPLSIVFPSLETGNKHIPGPVVDTPVIGTCHAGLVAVIVTVNGHGPATGAANGALLAKLPRPDQLAFGGIATAECLASLRNLTAPGQHVTRSVIKAGPVKGLVPTKRTELTRPQHLTGVGNAREERITAPAVRPAIGPIPLGPAPDIHS